MDKAQNGGTQVQVHPLQAALADAEKAMAAVAAAGIACGLKNSDKFAQKIAKRLRAHNATVPARLVKRAKQNERKVARIAKLKAQLAKANEA